MSTLCDFCGGNGRVSDAPCSVCNGTGAIDGSSTSKIDIISTETKFYPDGDMLITITDGKNNIYIDKSLVVENTVDILKQTIWSAAKGKDEIVIAQEGVEIHIHLGYAANLIRSILTSCLACGSKSGSMVDISEAKVPQGSLLN